MKPFCLKWMPHINLLFVGIFFFFSIPPKLLYGESGQSFCKQLYKGKLYTRAATCFFNKGESQRKQKNKSLHPLIYSSFKNAALCWRKSADKEKAEKASYLREKALLLYKKIIEEQLYASPQQKQLLQATIQKLKDKIGYITVSILTNNPKTNIEISGGYHFSNQKREGSLWKIKLRAGSYTILAHFPNGKKAFKNIQLEAKQQVLAVSIQPNSMVRSITKRKSATAKIPKKEDPPPQKSKLPKILTFAGAGLLVLGGAFIIIGQVQNSGAIGKSLSLQGNQKKKISDTQDIGKTHKLAQGFVFGGWTGVVLGVILGGVGATMWAISSKKADKAQKRSSTYKNSSTNQSYNFAKESI